MENIAWMNIAVFAVGLTAVIITIAWALLNGSERLEKINAKRRVDKRFEAIWDGSKTNELYCWFAVKYELVTEGRPAAELEAADKRIVECGERRRTFRKVKLGNGRVVLTSTLN